MPSSALLDYIMARICFVTTTRADWGLLSPLAAELRRRGHTVLVAASNMHLDAAFGATASEIEADGFAVDAAVPLSGGDTPLSRAVATGECTLGMARAFGELNPDIVVALGDRYEMLGAVTAAAVSGIPVVHIAGGEISEGAQDDAFRHAITKLSDLHLTSVPEYACRVLQMGEEPERVMDTGAIGVYNFMQLKPVADCELSAFLGINLEAWKPLAIVTYHPATLDRDATHAARTLELLRALEEVTELKVVITYPNNDAGGAAAIPLLEEWAAAHADRARIFPSLGARRYLSLLRHAAMVVGNSSSGIVEVPSAGIPTVDIGIRQQGRTAARSVLHCGTSASDIAQTIRSALDPDFAGFCRQVVNPYYKPDTLDIMADAIERYLSRPRRIKHFQTIPITCE